MFAWLKKKEGPSPAPGDNIRRPLKRLLSDSFVEHRKSYFAAIAAMVVVAGMTSMTAWIMGEIVDAMNDTENKTHIFIVSAAVAAIFIFKGIASFLQVVLMARAGNRIVAQKQQRMFAILLNQGMNFFNTTESSDVLLRVTQSAQMARSVIDTIVTGFVRDLLTLTGLMVVMFYQQPVLSLISIVIGPVAIYSVRKIISRVREVTSQEMASLAEIIRILQETSTGIRVVKAFALESMMASRMDIAIRQVEKRANKIVRLEAATTPLMDTISGLSIASVVMLGAISIFGESAGSPGQLISFVTAFLMAYEPAKRLSRMRVSIESGMVGVRMMYNMIDTPITMTEASDAVDIPNGAGRLTMENIHFSYRDGTPVIRGINAVFTEGQTTALVGPSGGGKSTLLNLILRLYDPDSGRILIDGCDLRKASLASLRRKISYVGQDTFLFSASIMDNIRVADQSASDVDVLRAARIAYAHEFIENLPQGYQTHVGENGAFLSGGQRQRLAIARAVLRKSSVLLLDEATSALDSHSEKLVRDAIGIITRGITTVVVAHRISTVLTADQICYVENGEIVEMGSLRALIDKRGKFWSLYNQSFDVSSQDGLLDGSGIR